MVRHRLLPVSLAIALSAGCSPGSDGEPGEDTGGVAPLTAEEALALRSMWPLPATPPSPTNRYADDPYAAHLGQYLFFEPALSVSGDVSCATCHDPALGWSDGLRLGEGLDTVERHTMSLYNVGHNRWSYWDGRCDSLWCQAIEPIEKERELGSNRVRLVHQLVADPDLNRAYRETFGPLPDTTDWPTDARPIPGEPEHPHHIAWVGLNPDAQTDANRVLANVGKAIAAFERRIVSRNSPFDRFAEAALVDGEFDNGHLSPAERRGLSLFLGEGQCHFCHAGPAFSNQEFANVGLAQRPWLEPADRGRIDGIIQLWENPFRGDGPFSDAPEAGAVKIANLSTSGEQEGQFKVPPLRSIALSPPYMHGGHFDTLEAAVDHYGTVVEVPELGHREDMIQDLTLSSADVDDIVAFLESLTGEPEPAALTRQPDSPVYSTK